MKKVSVNKWKKMLPKDDVAEREVTLRFGDGTDTLNIMVKTNLSMMDRMRFSKEIVESCFDEIDGSYIPHAFDVSFAIMLVQYFTNIDVGSDIELAFDLTRKSDVISVIKGIVDEKCMDEIEVEVYELLQWEKARRMRSTKADELYDAVTRLVDKFSDMADVAKDNITDDKITDIADVLKRFGNQEELAKAVLKAQKEVQ